MRAVYCKCKNTYSIDCANNQGQKCEAPEYWRQGIGRINAIPENFLIQENGGYILQENNFKIKI